MTHIYLIISGKRHEIHLEHIVQMVSMGNYTMFYLRCGKKIVAATTLGIYEELLETSSFLRTHRSHLINTSYIKSYKVGRLGGTIILKNGVEAKISKRKARGFCEQLADVQPKFAGKSQ